MREAVVSGGSADVVVEAPCGPVRGKTSESVSSFLGIPYAAQPLGKLR